MTSEQDPGNVYCVIPVFNRIDATLRCIECLKSQTHKNITIVICDGGSTDQTPDIVAKTYPDAVVLKSEKAAWWGGSTRLGVDWVLKHSASDSDFLMLVNNDTEFDPAYVATLIRHSRTHDAAFCGVVVDADDPSRIIDAGVKLDWPNYGFRGQYSRPDSGVVSLDSSVLPGRGTIIPITAVRLAGTIDDKRFPHYISDYEFTYRVRTKGRIRLGVAFDAEIATRVDPSKVIVMHPLREGWMLVRDSVSRRSKRNIFDHYNFIHAHAPAELKRALKRKLIARHISRTIKPTYKALRIAEIGRGAKLAISMPRQLARRLRTRAAAAVSKLRVRKSTRKPPPPSKPEHRLPRAPVARRVLPGRLPSQLSWLRLVPAVVSARFVHTSTLASLGLDELKLRRLGIVRDSRLEGYLRVLKRRSFAEARYPEAVALYSHVHGAFGLIGPIIRADISKRSVSDATR